MLMLISLCLLASTSAQQKNASVKKDSSKIFHLSSIEMSSGKGAISSGTYIYFNLTSKKAIFQTTTSQEDIEVSYFYRLFKDKLLIGPNIGYFHNIPFAGPEAIFAPSKFFSTFHWFGWSLGQPEGKIDPKQTMLMFAANSVTLSVKNVSVTYCLINYMKNLPQHTASLKYTQKINSLFSVYSDTGYDFLNHRQLLKMGIIWKQKN